MKNHLRACSILFVIGSLGCGDGFPAGNGSAGTSGAGGSVAGSGGPGGSVGAAGTSGGAGTGAAGSGGVGAAGGRGGAGAGTGGGAAGRGGTTGAGGASAGTAGGTAGRGGTTGAGGASAGAGGGTAGRGGTTGAGGASAGIGGGAGRGGAGGGTAGAGGRGGTGGAAGTGGGVAGRGGTGGSTAGAGSGGRGGAAAGTGGGNAGSGGAGVGGASGATAGTGGAGGANTCGNGVVDPGELCDPGTPAGCPTSTASCNDGDVCTQDSFHRGAQGVVCQSYCTNPPRSPSLTSSDGCCPDGATRLTDADCVAFCGDGIKDANEECDDGNASDTDACPRCKNAYCGDGFVRAGIEECDDGNGDALDACDDVCYAFSLCSGNPSLPGCYQPGVFLADTPWEFELGDFDGDGHVDIAIRDGGIPMLGRLPVFIYYGDGNGGLTGVWPAFSGLNMPSALAAGDFDGDGLDDIAVSAPRQCPLGTTTRGFYVYYGRSDRTFSPAQHVQLDSADVSDLVAIQADSDAPKELLMWSACYNPIGGLPLEGNAYVLDSNFVPISTRTNSFRYTRVVVANLDADPQDELIMMDNGANGTGRYSWSNAVYMNGWPGQSTYFSDGFVSIEAKDLDGDGQVDLAGYYANGTGDGVAWQSGGFGARTRLVTNPVDVGPVVAFDYDRDGDTDLAVAHAVRPTIDVYFRQADGSYRNPVRTQTGIGNHELGPEDGSWPPLGYADFNEDGVPDLIIFAAGLHLLLSR